MTVDALPLLLEPDQLEPLLGTRGLCIVDVGKAATYAQLHVPGAVHLDYARIVAMRRPVAGLLPETTELEHALSSAGISNDSWVVAYDDEGGGNASRLVWTLDTLGHDRFSLLNGGLHAWANEGHPLENRPVTAEPGRFHAAPRESTVADREYILEHLGDPDVALVDARSVEEFNGSRRFAARGGHIPGAVNMDWLNVMDRQHNLRLKPEAELRSSLEKLGVTRDREVVAYCQTHHRSSLVYLALKVLGYGKIRGYPGSWSDWGNQPDTPVESP
jgi:thiosulfate/3-mercaptopyruvate sulfurtransferase